MTSKEEAPLTSSPLMSILSSFAAILFDEVQCVNRELLYRG
jgi:hypothetical protein